MKDHQLGAMETRFAEIIWANAPLASGQLVKLCAAQLEWKKSTTYTMLRRLCKRGIAKNENGMVEIIRTKEELAAVQSQQFVQETFGGSLPSFLAAFTTQKKLSDEEIRQLEQLIAAQREAAQ